MVRSLEKSANAGYGAELRLKSEEASAKGRTMTLQPLIPGLVVVMVASIASIVWSVGEGDRALTFAAALAFPAAAVLICVIINRPMWRLAGAGDSAATINASRRNARLMALVYAWGAAAIFAIYSLTQLWWWHSWQYGLAMAFIACCLHVYAQRMRDPASPLVQPRVLDATAVLALVQAAAAAIGLAFLIGSGKLALSKPDWPANHVFIAGGLGLILISLIAAFTHRKLRSSSGTGSGAEQPSSPA